ncbi:hypothetical protein [Kamptonema formosum]|uniref:hypothetical protein n=1 Tax=Kamptonema formosum TaxID=331992 RepID=UPI0012DFCD45|nr:hypothetical protein [Oscillatoria sp. PCC 10802]
MRGTGEGDRRGGQARRLSYVGMGWGQGQAGCRSCAWMGWVILALVSLIARA